MKLLIAAAFFMWLAVACVPAQQTSPLLLQRTIALPAGTAKFDHFAIDLEANRLFIAATGNHSIEVLDLNTGKVSETLTGLGKPHGLAWLADSHTLYASDGTQSDLKIFAGSPLRQVKSIKLSEDADDMVYDSAGHRLYVGHGGGESAPAQVAVVDTTSQTLMKNLPVATHPESLEIDNATRRIFVNVADAAEVALIDGKDSSPAGSWKLSSAKDNVPLAFDHEHNVLFVACRAPARLLVLDGSSGSELADLPAAAGADDLFYDAELHRVYLVAGAGEVDVYEIHPDKSVQALGSTTTSAGSKTGLFVAAQHALYVGSVANAGKEAEVLVYATR
jgi:hypothetical protein